MSRSAWTRHGARSQYSQRCAWYTTLRNHYWRSWAALHKLSVRLRYCWQDDRRAPHTQPAGLSRLSLQTPVVVSFFFFFLGITFEFSSVKRRQIMVKNKGTEWVHRVLLVHINQWVRQVLSYRLFTGIHYGMRCWSYLENEWPLDIV